MTENYASISVNDSKGIWKKQKNIKIALFGF